MAAVKIVPGDCILIGLVSPTHNTETGTKILSL